MLLKSIAFQPREQRRYRRRALSSGEQEDSWGLQRRRIVCRGHLGGLLGLRCLTAFGVAVVKNACHNGKHGSLQPGNLNTSKVIAAAKRIIRGVFVVVARICALVLPRREPDHPP